MHPTKANRNSDDVEAEIRRTVTRHYSQIMEIETLRNDIDQWRQRAAQAEKEVERLSQLIDQREADIQKLRDAVTTLRTQFETGGEIWLRAYDTLRALKEPAAPVNPHAFFQALTAPKTEEEK